MMLEVIVLLRLVALSFALTYALVFCANIRDTVAGKQLTMHASILGPSVAFFVWLMGWLG